MKSNEEKLRELRWELFKLKGKDMYTRYVKILMDWYTKSAVAKDPKSMVK